jgi:transcriptional regulator with XRE-family HTH domain
MSTHGSNVATYIASRIEASGQLQKDIAEKVGFERPNMITMVKQGRSRLPIDKIGPMAQALEIDPLALFSMCMHEYYPNTWKAIAPCLESAMTASERPRRSGEEVLP